MPKTRERERKRSAKQIAKANLIDNDIERDDYIKPYGICQY